MKLAVMTSEIHLNEVKDFINKRTSMRDELLDGLITSGQKPCSIQFRELFFDMNELIKLPNEDMLPVKLTNCQILEELNSGMKYTFIFDYIGSSQEFEMFDILNRGDNLRGKGHNKEDIEQFVYFPKKNYLDSPEVFQHMKWSNRIEVRITDDSSMAVCLNYASLFPDWQLNFQMSLLWWIKGQCFAPGKPIGLGGNIKDSIQKIEKVWGQMEKKQNKPVIWVFQDCLFQGNNSLFKDGSGNGALIRSAGLFQLYINAYNRFIEIYKGNNNSNNIKIKEQFDKIITEIFMLDQHDQSSLTHSGLQAQLSMVLLAFIQIKLLIKQLSSEGKKTDPNRILADEIKQLVKDFEDEYLEDMLCKYTDQKYRVQQIKDQISEIQSKKIQHENLYWQKFLNVNTDLGKQDYQSYAYWSILLLYYQLFYRNKSGEYMWEDAHFIQYLSCKRIGMREGINEIISNPQANSNTKVSSSDYGDPDKYDKYLNKGDSGYFGAYAPDCMSLVLHLVASSVKKERKENQSLMDYLYKIAVCKGDCDSYGAVLGTILAAFDENYHDNYKNDDKSKKDDALFHINNMKLKNEDFLSDLYYQVCQGKQQLKKKDEKIIKLSELSLKQKEEQEGRFELNPSMKKESQG